MMISLGAYAQRPFVPVNTEWNYGVHYNNYPPQFQGHYRLLSVGDTLIGPDTFSNISNQYFITSCDSFDYYFFRSGIPKKRLFKTNVQIGDTVTIDVHYKSFPIDTFMPVVILIDDIHPLTDNASSANQSPRVFEFSVAGQYSGRLPFPLPASRCTYVERIGQPGNFSFFTGFFLSSPAQVATPNLRCFTSPGYTYKTADFKQPCNYSVIGLNEISTQTDINVIVSVTPDIVEADFYFAKGVITHITLLDLKGNQLAEYKTRGRSHRESIDISGLRHGIYQCVIETNAGKTILPLSIE